MTSKRWQATALAAAGLLGVPLVVGNPYILHVGIFLLMYVALSSSLNIVLGLAGQPSLAHATFLGVGAYAAALAALRLHWPYWVNLGFGGVTAALLGLIVGLPSVRVRGHHLAIVTIGFAQIVRLIEINWDRLTSGPMGLPGIPTATIASRPFGRIGFYYLFLLIAGATLFVVNRISRSRIGRALAAVRDDEMAAEALGVDTRYYKVYAFVISTFWAGVCGAAYAHYMTFVSPDSFTQADSTTILCMVILGGSGTLFGPVIGASVLALAPELLRFASGYRYMLVGLVMVVAVIARQSGFDRLWKRTAAMLGRLLPFGLRGRLHRNG